MRALDLLQGTLDLLILRTLWWGPMHGYSVARLIRERSDGAFLIEEGALMGLDQATSESLSAEQGATLVMRVVLSIIGFGWHEANQLIDSHPELTEGAHS